MTHWSRLLFLGWVLLLFLLLCFCLLVFKLHIWGIILDWFWSAWFFHSHRGQSCTCVVVHLVGLCGFPHIFLAALFVWVVSGWVFSSVVIHVAVGWGSFSTSSGNGSRSACASRESIGAILSAPVAWREAWHCTHPNLLMIPFVPLFCSVCEVRKRSVAYSMWWIAIVK